MKKYIIDANIIFSALISGKDLFVSLFENNRIYAPDFITIELDKYRHIVLKKSKLPIANLQDFIQRLFRHITIIPNLYIKELSKQKAIELCENIDVKDVAYIALSIEMDLPFVTRDKKLFYDLKNKSFDNIILLEKLLKNE